MEWIIGSTQGAGIQEYHLMHDNAVRAIVKYNPLHHSARISSGGNHQLMYIESAGALSGKYLFTDAYAQPAGSIVPGKLPGSNGTITIGSKKYSYKTSNNPWEAFTVIDEAALRPVVKCGFNTSAGMQVNGPLLQSINKNCLLLGLCWYLMQPAVKENVTALVAT